jgi:hypothetical protein
MFDNELRLSGTEHDLTESKAGTSRIDADDIDDLFERLNPNLFLLL